MIPQPPVPYYQTWGGGRGDALTALDALTATQRKQLSEGARRALSMVTVISVPNASAFYGPTHFLGLYSPSGFWGTSPGSIALNEGMAPGSRSGVTLHESAHAFDFMNRRNPSSPFTENRPDLLRRYTGEGPGGLPLMKLTGGYYETPFEAMRVRGIGPIESYATGAMLGPEGVPIDLLNRYASLFGAPTIAKTIWSRTHGR